MRLGPFALSLTLFSAAIAGTVDAYAKRLPAEHAPGQVLVRFRGDVHQSAAQVILAARRDGAAMLIRIERFDGSELVNGLRLAFVDPGATLEAVAALNARPDVLYAEPNYIVRRYETPDDPHYRQQWAFKNTGQVGRNDFTGLDDPGVIGADIDAERAWSMSKGSNSVVVGVLDGGIDIQHEDLRDNIWVNSGEIPGDNVDNDNNGFVDDVNGWDFHHGDKTVFDDEPGDDHGTGVAGIIGAKPGNGRGVAGLNWQVRIMPLKVLGPDGGSTSNIIRGYQYVRMMRERGIDIRVVNNSYGSSNNSQAAFDAIRALNEIGVLFVAAAGNEGADNYAFPHFPSGYDLPNILSVAASDRFDQLARFSNFGSRAVSMAAPGRGIWTTLPKNTYNFSSGTSFAAPFVAGSAALLLAANPNLSVQQLRGALMFTGSVLSTLRQKTTTGRRLNAFAAMETAAERDTIAPATAPALQVIGQTGRLLTLAWLAPGDDGDAGTAADYDLVFVKDTGIKIPLAVPIVPMAAKTPQVAVVALPFLSRSGSIELRTFDNAGNSSAFSIPVTIDANAGIDPYVMTQTEPQTLSTGGTALMLHGDDRYRKNVALLFPFRFYDTVYSSLTISTNGALYFSPPPERFADPANPEEIGNDAFVSIRSLGANRMVAALWDDLRTDRAGGDVFVVQPDQSRIIFRWQGVTFPDEGGGTRGENPVNFETELRSDGTIILRYGSGQDAPTNAGVYPVVGISGGEPEPYVVASHTHTGEPKLINLTNAQTVTFTPRPPAPIARGPRRRAIHR